MLVQKWRCERDGCLSTAVFTCGLTRVLRQTPRQRVPGAPPFILFFVDKPIEWVPLPSADFRRVGCDTVCGATGCNCFHFPICGTTLPVQLHHSFFTKSKGSITAPAPQFGGRNQSSFYRVPMHVSQLLCDFAIRIHVEVIVAALPESRSHPLPQLTL